MHRPLSVHVEKLSGRGTACLPACISDNSTCRRTAEASAYLSRACVRPVPPARPRQQVCALARAALHLLAMPAKRRRLSPGRAPEAMVLTASAAQPNALPADLQTPPDVPAVVLPLNAALPPLPADAPAPKAPAAMPPGMPNSGQRPAMLAPRGSAGQRSAQ